MVYQLNGTKVAPLSTDNAAILQIVTSNLLQGVTTGDVNVTQVPVRHRPLQ